MKFCNGTRNRAESGFGQAANIHDWPCDRSPIHDLRIASASLSTVLSESGFTGFRFVPTCSRSTLVLESLSWELNFGIFLFIIFFTGLQRAGASVVWGNRHGLLIRRPANWSRPRMACIAAERRFFKSSIQFQSGLNFHAFLLKLRKACFDFFNGYLHVYVSP